MRGLPEFGGELPVATLAEEIETPGDGQVRALLTVAGNPVLSTPDGSRLDEALAGLDFMVAVDIYLNETTRHADVILPPTTALERDHYDLVFHALAVRNTARFTPAVFAEAATTHGTTGRSSATSRSGCTARAGPQAAVGSGCGTQARLAPRPTRSSSACCCDRRRRLAVRELRSAPRGRRPRPARPTPARPAPDRRTSGSTWRPTAGASPTSTGCRATLAAPAEDGELLLIGRRHQRDNNSWMHNAARLTRGKPRHQLLMHPDDLAARGIADGSTVEVASRVGTVERRGARPPTT